MNDHDSEQIAALLAREGMEPADDAEHADVVVLNTCCIRENADNKLYGHLGHLKSLKESRPGLVIAVGGCLAQRERHSLLDRASHIDVVFGTHNIASLARLLDQVGDEPVVEVLDGPPSDDPRDVDVESEEWALVGSSGQAGEGAPGSLRGAAPSAYVTIQRGCDNSCTFCTVPMVRGAEVSRPLSAILAEVSALSRRGVTEVTLLGQNVNSYGRDITRRRPLFADLLRQVGSVEGIRRVRFTSPHPKDLRPETIEAMATTPAICEQLHLPLQSGSDRVLARMRRGYSAERYLERLAAARKAIPDLAVTTDLIVGFPGETDDDAERTLEVVAEAGFDSAYTFVFSPRPGTRAATMEADFVAPEIVSERFARLAEVVQRSALACHRARVGREEEVLVEGPSKRNPALLSGRTRQGKLVHFRAEEVAESHPGSYVKVRVTGAAPHHLTGVPVELVSTPARRRAIPVAAAWR